MDDRTSQREGVNLTSALALTQQIVEPPIEDQTGSDIDAVVRPDEMPDLLTTLGTLNLTPKQNQILSRPPSVDEVSIKPTGEPYVPAAFYRKILNDAFGRGRWGLRPFDKYRADMRQRGEKGQSVLLREYGLVVRKTLVSIAMGECEYHPSNTRMTYGDAAEGVRSNALMRLCKDFGVFLECWQPQWTARFRAEHCVKVFVDEGKPQWRRLDQEPFWNETGVTDDSPNQDRYVGRAGAGRRRKSRDNASRDNAVWASADYESAVVNDDFAQPPAEPSEPVETIATTRQMPNKKTYGIKGSRSGEAFTDDVSLYNFARQLCSENRRVRLIVEIRYSESARRDYRHLVEIVPVNDEEVKPF